ncbi:MAG: hypothetical protein IMZ71_01195 [Chloroflexi bacterium]|nr:hypothetical protein [Chloroflexota bacterium]
MDGAKLGMAKKESPIEQELKRLLDHIGSLRDGHAKLYVALAPVLRQPELRPEGPSQIKGESDNSSPLLRSLEELSREIVVEARAVAEMTDRLEL